MNFKSKNEYEEYKKESQLKLNEWADKFAMPGVGIGRDENGNVKQITQGNRMESLQKLAETNPEVVSKVDQPVKEIEAFEPPPVPKGKEGGCKTCAAKGLKRLILGGAKLLKSELGIDAADEETVEKRKKLCIGCDKYDFGVCSDCGCFCAAKVKLTSEKCPIGKW
jgi:hypothetical protein